MCCQVCHGTTEQRSELMLIKALDLRLQKSTNWVAQTLLEKARVVVKSLPERAKGHHLNRQAH
jgi:hypothetical protein